MEGSNMDINGHPSHYLHYSPWFPNPALCASDILRDLYAHLLWDGVRSLRGTLVDSLVMPLRAAKNVDWGILLHPLIISMVLTLLRVTLNNTLFKVGTNTPT